MSDGGLSSTLECTEWQRYASAIPFAYWSSAATPSRTVAVATPTPTDNPTTAETN